MFRITIIAAAWLLVSTLLAGCNDSQPTAIKPVRLRLQLKWVHQAQFAGFYVAREQGYYSEENLEVEFIEGGVDVDQAAQLRNGAAEFAVLPAEAILLKNTQQPLLVAIAVIYQRNPTVFVAKQASGILGPKDFTGKRVAVGKLGEGGFIEGIIQLQAMLNNTGVDTRSVLIADYDPKYTEFLKGSVDITPAYLTGGVIKLRDQGLDLSIVWPGDYGVDTYSDTLAATDSYIAANPDIVLRFLRASLRGWQTAIEDQAAALAASMKYARIQDARLQTEMLDAQAPLVATGDKAIGSMEKVIWEEMYKLYSTVGLIDSEVDISRLHTLHFLETLLGDMKQ